MKMFKKIMAVALTAVMAVSMLTGCALTDAVRDKAVEKALESKLSGRKVALFGSYGWGDGQWMRDWVQRTNDANAVIYTDEGLIINETPDEDGLAKCKEFGKGFAAF